MFQLGFIFDEHIIITLPNRGQDYETQNFRIFHGSGMVAHELKNKGKMLSTDYCVKMLIPP